MADAGLEGWSRSCKVVRATVESICDAAVRGAWLGTDARERDEAIERLRDLCGGPEAVPEGLPTAVLYEMVPNSPSYAPEGAEVPPPPPPPLEVVVGFRVVGRRGLPPVELDVTVEALGGVDGVRVTSTLCLSDEDVLVPAWLGQTILPVLSIPGWCGLRVHVRPAEAGRDVRAVCATLRPDVRAAVAASKFALPYEACGGEGGQGSRVIALPDLWDRLERLPASCRQVATRARVRERTDAYLRELMEVVWAPSRVASGLVDLDW